MISSFSKSFPTKVPFKCSHFQAHPTNLLLGQYIIIYPIKYPQSISIIVIVFQSFSRKRWFWDAETHDSQSQFFRWFMKWGRLFFFFFATAWCEPQTAWGYAMVQVFLQPEPLLVWSTIYIIYVHLCFVDSCCFHGWFFGVQYSSHFFLDTNPIPELDHGCTPVIKHGKKKSTFYRWF